MGMVPHLEHCRKCSIHHEFFHAEVRQPQILEIVFVCGDPNPCANSEQHPVASACGCGYRIQRSSAVCQLEGDITHREQHGQVIAVAMLRSLEWSMPMSAVFTSSD